MSERDENVPVSDTVGGGGATTDGHGPRPATLGLTIAALGVVFGDIGTSPLYAFRETFMGHGHELLLPLTEKNILGALSLVFWSMIIVVSVKYLALVMRADNHGEGGILALTALVRPPGPVVTIPMLVMMGLFGAALLYGDGMITPAISVLSAVEGVEVVTPSLTSWVVPIAVVILVALFSVQHRGTAAVGRVFGPVVLLWFATLALLGVSHLHDAIGVFKAINPIYGVEYFLHNGWKGFHSLGSVFLVVTGAEALYADMGHFGRPAISRGWVTIVMPCLMLNYFGQGAMLISHPDAIENPFYRMAPEWGLWPLVVLATAATVIASQALISGAFSLTRQAVQLGYLPRVKIEHTSHSEEGQIYVPAVNYVLLIACVLLVVGFQKSTNLAAAYGLAVTATMAVTTVLFYRVAIDRFRWNKLVVGIMCAFFLVVDLGFLGANIPKIPAGGWLPLTIGVVLLVSFTTWATGRRLTSERITANSVEIDEFAAGLGDVMRGPGTGVYLGPNPHIAPHALRSQLQHSGVLPTNVCVVSVVFEPRPTVDQADRFRSRELGGGVHQIVIHCGFMEEVDVPGWLAAFDAHESLGLADARFVLGRETVRATGAPGMALWRERMFILMMRNATPADAFFSLPPDRSVEIGVQVEI